MKNKKYIFFKNIFDSHIESKNVKGTYSLVKKVMGWSSVTQPKMFLIEGKLIRKPLELANTLQKFYIEKVNSLVRRLNGGGCDPLRFLKGAINRWSGRDRIGIFNLREISESETLKLVQKLGNTTAFGRDGLDGLSMKVAISNLLSPLTHIINMSIHTNKFASKWKLSRVIPILKSKDASRLSPSSYRPVALLPVVSKIVERVIQTQLQEHMECHGLLNMNGHTYRQNVSTATAIMQVMDRPTVHRHRG